MVSRETPILVSTDVGARGLDSAHADLVINIEFADAPETMAHRIGRGGRFGKCAQCIFITATEDELNLVTKFGETMRVKLENFKEIEKMVKNINGKLKSSKTISEREQEMIQKEIPENSEIQENVAQNLKIFKNGKF